MMKQKDTALRSNKAISRANMRLVWTFYHCQSLTERPKTKEFKRDSVIESNYKETKKD